jgi:hypothetical protein
MEKRTKRKRREYAKDERYIGLRRIVDELNKAIGPEQRRKALHSTLLELSSGDVAKFTASLDLGTAEALTLLLSMSDDEEEIGTIAACLELVFQSEKEGLYTVTEKWVRHWYRCVCVCWNGPNEEARVWNGS